ncbi:MAG: ABC transporter ATP-binding protein [Phycisphaeraceae bacterium]|nr:ABC transporter ATP-binding protein [Phycisphaeraceae bacterium]
MNHFWRMAFHLLHPARKRVAIAMVFAFISAGGLGAGLVGLGPIFRILLDPTGEGSLRTVAAEWNAEPGRWIVVPTELVERLPATPLEGVTLVLSALIVLAVIGAAANFLHQFIAQTLSARAVARIRAEAFSRVVEMPLGRVISRGPSEFVARIANDAELIQNGIIALVSRSVTQVTKGVAAFLAALWFDWRLAMAAVLIAPLLAIVLRKLGKRIRRGTRRSLDAREVLLRIATESLQGLRGIKANAAEQHAVRRFERVNDDVVRHELRIRTARAVSTPLVELMAVVALAVLALLAARSIVRGQIAPDTFILTLGALGVAGGSFRPLTGIINELHAAAAPCERVFDLLAESPEPDGAARPALAPLAKEITFDSVSYAYPGADRPALDTISLRIRAGEHIAIVGPNGCGKTTLVSLLPRLLVPTQGCVRFDGIDIGEVTLRSLRSQIAVVTQETTLFRGTVHENIAFGCEDVTEADVRAAARAAFAHEFIERLPGAYAADLAEQGGSLSGGQRQRIAIARAILRRPALLILDEATSQIDSESEARIGEVIRSEFAGRTVVAIAHRLSTVLAADRIVVMDGGRIEAVAPHARLLESSPLYRRLVDTQLVAAG